MRRKREYLLILAITCLSWGIFFPEYTFTADSYQLIAQENVNDEEDEEPEDVRSAVRSGRVRYKWKFAEYIKSLFG